MTQVYLGVKQVTAWPQDKDGEPGYGIKYADGHISWSPKKVFETAYLPMGEHVDDSKINEQMVDNFITGMEVTRMGNHTVVRSVLKNGFSLITESACVDTINYDEDVGIEVAVNLAKNKVWELLGFLLATARNGISNS